MTNEQIAKEIKTGNNDLIPELWEATRLYIFHALNHIVERNRANQELMVSAGVTKEDLDQEAFFILLEAVNAFDTAGGYSFISSLKFATEKHFFELVGMRTAKGRHDPLNNSDRFEQPIGNGDDELSLGDTIPDQSAQGALEAVIEAEYQRQCRTDLQKVMTCLKPTEKRIIVGRYYENKELAALGREYGIPTAKTYQCHQSALRKLRGRYELIRWRDDIIDRSYALGGMGFFKATGSSSVEWAVCRLERQA
jgi:RNA polymerase sigma factor (sigma-70 family)